MKPVAKTRATVRRRPAETGGILAAAIVVILAAVGVDDPSPALVAAIVVLVGAVPAVVTWIRER
jgi:Mn2+/Fe2+ NRAMP family transporter